MSKRNTKGKKRRELRRAGPGDTATIPPPKYENGLLVDLNDGRSGIIVDVQMIRGGTSLGEYRYKILTLGGVIFVPEKHIKS